MFRTSLSLFLHEMNHFSSKNSASIRQTMSHQLPSPLSCYSWYCTLLYMRWCFRLTCSITCRANIWDESLFEGAWFVLLQPCRFSLTTHLLPQMNERQKMKQLQDLERKRERKLALEGITESDCANSRERKKWSDYVEHPPPKEEDYFEENAFEESPAGNYSLREKVSQYKK